MQAFLVTVACNRDDVVVGIRNSRVGAGLRQREVLDLILSEPNWLTNTYGEMCREDPGQQTTSEPVCVRVLAVTRDLVQVLSNVSVDDYSERKAAS